MQLTIQYIVAECLSIRHSYNLKGTKGAHC